MREEILDKKQDQNNTEKETNDGPSQENKGGKQRPQTRKANDWNGGKGGSKKPKNTGDPLREVGNMLIPKTTLTPIVARGAGKKRK